MIDLDQARRYLEVLDAPGAAFTFQTFDDTKAKRPSLARVIHGRFEDVASELIALNQPGAGVFVCVNRTDLKGRCSENVIALRSLFVDIDGGPFKKTVRVPPPALVVQSGGGQHAYWPLRDGEPLHLFSDAQTQLAHELGGDTKVKDLPRVMRVPGFLHQKGAPVLVTVIDAQRRCYSIQEVVGALPQRPVRAQPERSAPVVSTAARGSALEQCRRYLGAVPGAVEGAGGDHQTYCAACIAVVDFDLSDADALTALAEWNGKCSPPWDERDLEAKIRHARRYAGGVAGSKLRAESPVSANAYTAFRERQRERVATYLRGAR